MCTDVLTDCCSNVKKQNKTEGECQQSVVLWEKSTGRVLGNTAMKRLRGERKTN